MKQPLFVEFLEDMATNYDLNGGTGTVPTGSNHIVGEELIVAPQGDISGSVYEFLGWNTKQDRSDMHYSAESTFKMGIGPVVLYVE